MGHKDLFDTRGVRTTYGSRIYEHHTPEADALIVERMEAAGAVSLGKTRAYDRVTIAELEQYIKENTGLHAEIFFRTENAQTTSDEADHWHLKDLFEVEKPDFSSLPFRNKDNQIHA